MRIIIKTLVDITKTGINRPDQGNELKRHQQSNFNTLQQLINMRSLIEENSDPAVKTTDISETKDFGSKFKGEHKVWEYEFIVPGTDVYATQSETGEVDDAIGLLKEDFNNCPVIGALTESITKPSVFKVKGNTDKNISFAVFDK